MNHHPTIEAPAPVLSKATLFVMAVATGALAANIYYAQPIVALIGDDLGMDRALESLIVTATQLGYAAGLVALVPLGDILENRRLILATIAACIVGLLGLALSPGLGILAAAIALVGSTSVAAQMIVPLVAHFAVPEQRGRAVGNVMTGLIGGILVSRPLASIVAGLVGWRGVFVLSAAGLVLLWIVLARRLPERRPNGRERYGALLASLPRLFMTQPVLRRRALIHAALFASFAIFWTAAPILLLRPPFSLGETGIALFALTGVLGVLAAPVSGRMADRGHSRIGTTVAILLVLGGMAIAWAAGAGSLAALVAAGVLLDLGVQANMVISQREIFGLDPALRNRVNSVYMTTFFLGGALGSGLTSPVFEAFGWPGVGALACLFPAMAFLYFLRPVRA